MQGREGLNLGGLRLWGGERGALDRVLRGGEGCPPAVTCCF